MAARGMVVGESAVRHLCPDYCAGGGIPSGDQATLPLGNENRKIRVFRYEGSEITLDPTDGGGTGRVPASTGTGPVLTVAVVARY